MNSVIFLQHFLPFLLTLSRGDAWLPPPSIPTPTREKQLGSRGKVPPPKVLLSRHHRSGRAAGARSSGPGQQGVSKAPSRIGGSPTNVLPPAKLSSLSCLGFSKIKIRKAQLPHANTLAPSDRGTGSPLFWPFQAQDSPERS